MEKHELVDKPAGGLYVKGIMFVVDHILVSDDLVGEHFSCNLGACLGACCVHGDSGAPLEPEELSAIEAAVPSARKYLRPEALEVIDNSGPWEETSKGGLATSCLNGRECVFVTYAGPVAKCALQKAYMAGRSSFKKPISCELFPVRAEHYGTYEVLNYERVSLCDSGRAKGQRQGMPLAEYLKDPLVRKYGEEWYERFTQACHDRRVALAS